MGTGCIQSFGMLLLGNKLKWWVHGIVCACKCIYRRYSKKVFVAGALTISQYGFFML